VPCMIASPTLPIGTWVYVAGNGALRHCRATDTSAPADRARHIRTRRIELSYDAARVLCPSLWGRPEACPITVIQMEEP